MTAWTRPPAIITLTISVLLAVTTAGPVAAQTPYPSAPATAGAPAPIAVPEVATRAEEVAALLRRIEAQLGPSREMESLEKGLPQLSERVEVLLEDTSRALERPPRLAVLDRLGDSWRGVRLQLSDHVAALTRRATTLEDHLARLAIERELWTRSREQARRTNAPASVIERIDATLAAIGQTRATVGARRTEVLGRLDQVSQRLAAADEALQRLERARRGPGRGLFVREQPPLWEAGPALREMWDDLPNRLQDVAETEWNRLGYFAAVRSGALTIHGGVFVGLALLLGTARRRALRRAGGDIGSLSGNPALALPLSSALILALLGGLWFEPQAPRVLRNLVSLALLVPAFRVISRVVDPLLVPALYPLAGLFLLEQVREVISVEPELEQGLMAVELVLAVAMAWWLRGSRWLAGSLEPAEGEPPWRRWLRTSLGLITLVFVVALGAVVLGYMPLARLVGGGTLVSAYAALVLYAAERIAEVLIGHALRSPPLGVLAIVARHRDQIEARAHRVLRVIAVAGWVYLTLALVRFLDPVVSGLVAVLGARVGRGSISLSLGDVLAFAVTVWLTFLVSAIVRVVLDDEVYPRLALPRGVPYTLSRLLHYAVLFVGFLVAIAAMGVDFTRITILAGAFGVGIGFGLQNVVQNFVAGLILLFERPVQVGDSVQIGDLQGSVRRIGIRASTLRSWEGADVIVPNSVLIAERVTNWTFSDNLRRIDLRIGVSYESDPARVQEVLLDVARAHPRVLTAPGPQALCMGFGESAISFELRVWTGRFDDWPAIRSDLAVSMHGALGAAGIRLPFPQHEVRLVGGAPASEVEPGPEPGR